jgi:LacI family transcriptional regulator
MSKNRQVILLLDMSNPYLRKVARSVATYAHQQGNWDFHIVQDQFDSLIYLMHDLLENPTDLRQWHPNGTIGYFSNPKIAKAIHQLETPVVEIEGEVSWTEPEWGIPYFTTDNEAIGRMGAQELIERGFKRLAFCGIPKTRISTWTEQRQASFVQFARETGVPCSVFVDTSSPSDDPAKLHEQLAAWLKSLEKPVGLMASYDVRARHVLTICRELEILVPEEVSVIGVNNDELICELTSPTLSSVEQGGRAIGFQAAALLDRLMDGEKTSQMRFVVQPEGIVTRRSSDAMAIDDPDIAAALRYIRQHACEGIQVSDVVQAVAISRTVLNERFKLMVGRTIRAEILRLQIDRARQLVAATDMPLNLVALHAGFRYLQQMITAFRRSFGKTPGEYRNLSRQGIAGLAKSPRSGK